MTTLVLDRRGLVLDYDADCLVLRHADLPTRSVPLRGLDRVLCMHGVQVATRLLGHCQRFGVDFIVLNARASDLSVALHASTRRSATRRMAQYGLVQAEAQRLALARRLVMAKIKASIAVVRPEADPDLVAQLRRSMPQVAASPCHAALRGREGRAQRAVFEHWRALLPATLGFTARKRRPPPDPVNAVLSLSYSLAYHEATRQALARGLDPWLGVYHEVAPGRYALSCDLIEPLRPRIERWVVSLFRGGGLDLRHFSARDGQCLLGKAGRRHFYDCWHAALPAWSRRLRRHARLLAGHVDRLPGAGEGHE